ncbi:hypothetical protein LZ269_21515 [Streptomyces lomondensis]|uniref:Uncharacterized protein n=1 Tax=Streptomyces lomondensis TaxID=68229 RepID=A0ABQ2X3D7_9ACTN|nr:hypothetical protein [Streptomyces lomondensis]GGW97190.1 hypothetical protein GCM10010383_28800 [Streptomyces lomondensis]
MPEHPDYPRILAAFNHATGPLRAKDVCEALGHELLPKNIEGTRAKLKRLVKLEILTEADSGNFTQRSNSRRNLHQRPCSNLSWKRTSPYEPASHRRRAP